MTKRTIIKAMAIVLTLPLFLSCSKDSVEESSPKVEEQGISLAESEATRLSIKNLIESSKSTSLTDFVSEAKKIQNIKDAIIEDSLVYLTTTAGGSICVDLYGSCLRKQDYEEYSVDTCGTYIQNFIDAIEEQYKDSISDGVEYDPLEVDSIDVSYGDEEDVITTRATLHHRKILNKKRMAIWEPWEDFARCDVLPFKDIVQKNHLNYEEIFDFSPSAFSKFSQYDLVYIGSHGAKDGSILLPIDYEPWYCSKYKYIKDGKTYVNESAMSKDGISYLYSTEYFGLVKKDRVALKLDKRFLNSHLSDLSNTIICTSMCYAGRSNSQLLQSAINKGCPEFYGADEPVEASGVGPMSFFRNFLVLFSNGSSAKMAYELGRRLMVKTNSKYSYNRYGNSNVTYFNPYITGVREVKDKSAILGVKFQFSLDIPGSVISETANQYGIYLKNLKKLIPLSNSNVVNQATTTLYNSVCAYYANVKIDDLTPDTEYRYHTYVIVNNKIFYSENAETFKTKEAPLCPDNRHPHAIDLGIGVKFACCNVGATNPTQYGNYYEWKESQSAVATWGSGWSMPNSDQLHLLTTCSYKWTSINGVNGMLFIGRNDNRIFLPAAGIRLYTGMSDVGAKGYYWASEHVGDDPDNGGCALYFNSSYPSIGYGFCYGYTVRPIAR